MVLVRWSNDYAVGVAEIDSQHRELFRLLDELNEATKGNGEDVKACLLQLIDLWRLHCRLEEGYMQKYRCSGLLAHRFAHEGFEKKLSERLAKMEQGESIAELESLPMLHAWLRGHILGTDKKHAPWILRQQQKGVAEIVSEFMVWTDDFSVGVAEIDAQHRELVEMINALQSAMLIDTRSLEAKRILDELVEYTARHFQSEEDYMIQAHFPEYEEHKLAHDEFVEKVHDLVSRADWGTDLLGLELLESMKSWLEEHLLDADRRYMECMKDAGFAASPLTP